ncbi:MAG: TldD/PmbA family protein [Planctomycetota bacterium]|nr:TldD/PmbA family protein [Planctomycetota bacterium]
MVDDLLKEARQGLALALQAGANDAVVSVSDGSSTNFGFRDGKIEKVQQNRSRGLNVRLYVDGRYSTHATTDLRPAQLKRFLEDAVALTRHLEPDPFRTITDPKLYAGRSDANLDMVDEKIEQIAREEYLAWLAAMDKATHADSRVISATSFAGGGRRLSAMVSSNGFEGTRDGTGVGYGGSVTLDEGNGKRPEASKGVHGAHLLGLPAPEAAAGEALTRALERLGASKGPSARMTMVVDREAGGRLLGPLVGALSAGAIQQKRSFLAGRKGERVASELLTLTDDPLLPRGMGSQLFDGEGIAATRMPVFERGVLKDYYVDTYYGKKLGWEPTTGGSSNLLFALGSKDRDGLLNDAGEGVYVTGWLGGNSDGTTGDFSFGIRGHKIEAGKKGAPLVEMNVTGNILELWQNLAAVGNDPYEYSSVRTPTLVFKDVNFSGK